MPYKSVVVARLPNTCNTIANNGGKGDVLRENFQSFFSQTSNHCAHRPKKRIISSFRYVWLVHSNVDRNSLEIPCRVGRKSHSTSRIWLLHIKTFKLSPWWSMDASDAGKAPSIRWGGIHFVFSAPPWISIQCPSLGNMLSYISNATSRTRRRVLHPSNCCPSLTC